MGSKKNNNNNNKCFKLCIRFFIHVYSKRDEFVLTESRLLSRASSDCSSGSRPTPSSRGRWLCATSRTCIAGASDNSLVVINWLCDNINVCNEHSESSPPEIITRSSAIAEMPMRYTMSVKMLCYSCTNNADRSRVSLRSTYSNSHNLFRCLHSFYTRHSTIAQRACDAVGVINILLYHQPCWCQLDCNWDDQIWLPPGWLMTLHIPPQIHHHRRGRLWQMNTNVQP